MTTGLSYTEPPQRITEGLQDGLTAALQTAEQLVTAPATWRRCDPTSTARRSDSAT